MNDQQGNPRGTNKKYAYAAIGIVILAFVAWGIYSFNHQGSNQNNQQASIQGTDNNLAAGPAATSTEPSAAKTPAKLSYGDAIKAYPERFQFTGCQGSPAIIAVKLGSPVMLDNRNAVAHTIVADKQTFKLAGYNYAVLYPKTLGNLVVTCDGKNSVTLNVQK